MMERLTLAHVPVRLETVISPAYYRQVKAEVTQRLDVRGMLEGLIRRGEAWVNEEWARIGGARAIGEIQARVGLEGGKVGLRGRGLVAEVGQPLKTVKLHLKDGLVTAIEGGRDG